MRGLFPAVLAALAVWVAVPAALQAAEGGSAASTQTVVQAGAPAASAVVAAAPAKSPEALQAERELLSLQQWWEAHQRWFYMAGGGVFAVLLVWLLIKFRLWVRRDPGETFRCGTLLYSKKGLVLMFAWLLWGDFCYTLMQTIDGSIIPWKCRELNASNKTIGIVQASVPALFNFLITPSISIWSDRVRTRWGRRLPFILATMPFLVVSAALIAFSDDISAWIAPLLSSGSPFDQAKVAIMVLAVCAGMFDLFNTFLNTVYWYLFNDVVPREMMGRFMGYFRVVSTLTTAFYSFFLFKYALSHMRELYLAAAGIYLVGFGAMCLRVKESEYPPPEDAGPRVTLREKARHILESLRIQHYLNWTLRETMLCFSSGMAAFGGFLTLSLVLTMQNIGIMSGIQMIIAPVFLLFVGVLVDRWNPIRVVGYLMPFATFFCLGGWIWLFVDHPSPLVFMLTGILGGICSAPMGAIQGVAGLPGVFALLPRDKFGQYNGAMCMIRAVAIFAGGWMSGLYLDVVRGILPPHADDPNWVYRCMFPYQAVWSILSTYFGYKMYRGWKRLGGDKSYVPPVHQFRLRDLPPHPDVDGRVHWGLIGFTAVSVAGIVLSAVIWVGYYVWWQPNPHYAWLFALGGGIAVLQYLLYLRFIKFMERP